MTLGYHEGPAALTPVIDEQGNFSECRARLWRPLASTTPEAKTARTRQEPKDSPSHGPDQCNVLICTFLLFGDYNFNVTSSAVKRHSG